MTKFTSSDGMLVVDKPIGPTSHDVVARVRRILRERRIGHTGTLDPLASGVLVLVIGRATRLARFLSAANKVYRATVQLGVATDSGDAAGAPIASPYRGPWPDAHAIDRALDEFRGRFLQQPPALSAKKIAGRPSYALARSRARRRDAAGGAPEVAVARSGELPAPVAVTAYAISVVSVDRGVVVLTVNCSPGFYVRALAHDLGERLGVGAHLGALRRIRSGGASTEAAIALADIEGGETGHERALAAMVPLDAMLPNLPAIRLAESGVRKVASGRDLSGPDLDREPPGCSTESLALPPDGRRPDAFSGDVWYRLIDPRGHLLGLGVQAPGSRLLHPSVVLV